MNKTLKELIEIRGDMTEKCNKLINEINNVNDGIHALVYNTLDVARGASGKDTGIVAIIFDGIGIKQDIPKKVIWDQDALKVMHTKIFTSGDEPGRYIDTKYNVPEKRYKEFPVEIKNVFSQARIIKPGKTKLTFQTDV